LGNLSQLSKLLLDFSETCTRSEDIEKFNRDVLPSLVFLEHFELYLSKMQQSKTLPDELAKNLFIRMPKLKVLNIDLSYNGKKTESLEALVEKIFDGSNEIQHLQLYLNDSQICNQEVQKFFMKIPKSLTTLVLHLENNLQLTNTIFNMKNIGKEEQLSLEGLELVLTNAKVNGEGLMEFLNRMKKTVKSLKLNLEGIKVHKDFVVKLVCDGLGVMENMESLEIDGDCLGVVEKDLSNAFLKNQKMKNFVLKMQKQIITKKSIEIYQQQQSPQKKK